MAADLVTKAPTVRLQGAYVFVTLCSGDSKAVYVLEREQARALASDIEAVLIEAHNNITPLPKPD